MDENHTKQLFESIREEITDTGVFFGRPRGQRNEKDLKRGDLNCSVPNNAEQQEELVGIIMKV